MAAVGVGDAGRLLHGVWGAVASATGGVAVGGGCGGGGCGGGTEGLSCVAVVACVRVGVVVGLGVVPVAAVVGVGGRQRVVL